MVCYSNLSDVGIHLYNMLLLGYNNNNNNNNKAQHRHELIWHACIPSCRQQSVLVHCYGNHKHKL